MKPKIFSFYSFLFFVSIASHSQNLLIPAIDVSVPAYIQSGSFKGYGFGANITGEHFINRNFSITASAGYEHFSGHSEDQSHKINSFNLIPVNIGMRYHLRHIYIGLETGPALKGSADVIGHNTISPTVGYESNKVDIALKLVNVLGMPSIPENTFLQKGGYGFFSLRFGWRFK